ncbi:MAG: hypothetical protein WA173_08240, partial [Pseudomonas sp.]|uniref:hypothetical protein n=1 Tax=Pseudomonas sp. TaxID=306 RepID=UPI003BB53418
PRLCKNVFEQVLWPESEQKSRFYANLRPVYLTKHRQILSSNADFKPEPAFLHSLDRFLPEVLAEIGQERSLGRENKAVPFTAPPFSYFLWLDSNNARVILVLYRV